MAEAAGVLIDVVLQRVRDTQGLAHSRAFVLDILSEAQRFVNARHNAVVGTSVLTTQPRLLFYPVTAMIPNALRIRGVREGSRDLDEVKWTEFQHVSRTWAREVGDRFEAWALAGRDLLIVYPARDVAASVTVAFTKLTTKLASEVDLLEVSEELIPSVVELAEAILSIRGKFFATVASVAERMAGRA